ncbi:MAG: glycosyltransferase family 2 protein [Melioribacteraceae bacterium]|nr:glycosyltransferase family 2 protein [Melioribacteraceae bacterium]
MQNYINNNLPNTVKTYLTKYAYRIEKLEITKLFECIVVIPVLDEFDNLPKLIISLKKQNNTYLNKTLFLFVVNNSDKSEEELIQNNLNSIKYLKNTAELKEINISVIDAASVGKSLPDKIAGVGLARKIGMDSALQYFNYDVNHVKFLVCLDADCTVSENYLDELFSCINHNKLKAGYVKYHHQLTEDLEINKAIIVYEIFLRYYVLGLKYANSPYAFHTIGSTMFCDYESYIKIEGMNKRKAAEDFYFMEKLSKTTSIFEIKNAVVYPSSRPSWRVPFGTGQRVNRYLSKTQNEYQIYSPQIFDVLKEWSKVFHNKEIESSNYYLMKAKEISISLYDFLIQNNFETAWDRIKENSKSTEIINNQKKLWFDGFRTLKLIHYLRDNQFGLINIFDAVDQLLLKCRYKDIPKRKEEVPSISLQQEYLSILRELA